VPARRDARGEQRLHLGGEVKDTVTLRIIERFDPESVARGEERLIGLVPEHERELAAQLVQALRPELLVEAQGDFAVRSGAQPVALLLELALDALVVVELAIDHDVQALVLIGDRLITGDQVNDAEARVPEPDAAMWRDPLPLPVRSAMVQTARRAFQRL